MKSAIVYKKTELILLIIWFSLAIISSLWSREIYSTELASLLLLPCVLLNRFLLPKRIRAKGRTAVEIILFAIVFLFVLVRISDADDSSLLAGLIFFMFWILPVVAPGMIVWYLLICWKELHIMKVKEFSLR